MSIALIVIIFQSCKNPADGFVITVNSDISTNNFGFRVLNANQTVEEIPQNLIIKIAGPNADIVYSSDGSKNFTAGSGIFSLILEPGIKPSPANTIKFTIIIESNGYIKSITPIEIIDEGSKSFDIFMVKKDNPPLGVAVKDETIVLPSNGELAVTTIIEIPLNNGKQETAKLEIPKGTKMLDENGNIITGSVSVSLAHFDNRNQESLNSFPGGFTATNLIDENGKEMDPVIFETAGFISIDMNNGTQTVKSFSNPIAVTMGINDNTINTETNTAVKEGDSIPTWSLDTKTGQWKKEAVAVIVKNSTTNKLETVFNIPHLSWWNLDYYYNSCTYGSRITINSNTNSYTYRYMELVNSNNTYFRSLYESVKNGNVIGFYRAPIGRSVKLRIYSGTNYYNKGSVIAESGLFQMCGNSTTISVNIPPPTIVNIDISGKCVVGGRVIRPSLYVLFKEKGKYYYDYLGYMYNGKMTTDRFVLGKTYVFAAYYSGRLFEYERVINSTNYTEIMSLTSGTPGCK
ncbi:MAG: hypothetical protein K9G64_05135 [Bacteroidia bacterium]|nr:hypothetical protein [Bacteroidia bacterium]